MYNQFVFDACSDDEGVPGMCQWMAGQELKKKKSDVEYDVENEEAVNDP